MRYAAAEGARDALEGRTSSAEASDATSAATGRGRGTWWPLLRAPRAVAERVVYRLRKHGTSAAVVAIRAREAYGAVSAEVARAAIREITSRASPPGSVSLAEEAGGAVSLAGEGGQLGLPGEEP